MKDKVPVQKLACAPLSSAVRCHMRIVALSLLSLLGVQEAAACTCSMPTVADQAEVQKAVELLFVGEVLEVSTNVDRGVEVVRARFKVQELKKGPKTPFVIIEVHHGGTSCDLVRASFKVGERYLVSGNLLRRKRPDAKDVVVASGGVGVYYSNYCDLRERLV